MEFPSLGQQCFENTCKQLDFLPMKCDACSNIFCSDHIQYTSHSCPDSYKKDNQVPVCPLCNKPIPVKKGELPDVVVGRHIDSDCQSDPAKERRKIYTNKCSHKGCKQKELVPVKCSKCHKNYCLKHRHEEDHNCQGFENTGRGMSQTGAAALFRFGNASTAGPSKSAGNSKPQKTSLSNIGSSLHRERQQREAQKTTGRSQAVQGSMSEDEAMARAIQLSLAETQSSQQTQPKNLSQEEEDLLLAQALAASEEEARRARNRQQAQPAPQEKSTCAVS